MKNRILNILFWSVISAAFIGPGTITTASKAGADFGYSLLWALVFSTLACLVLQEAVARLTILSGKSLGEAIRYQYQNTPYFTLVLILVIGAIIIGSAAYETGNILGAVAGLQFLLPWNALIFVFTIGMIAFLVLNIPSLKGIARFMGYVVVVMGISFFTTAILLKPDIFEILKGSFIPKMPEGNGAGILVLGLIGTTVVPYNLFLGSGIAGKGQQLKEMRFGLSIAVLLGGLISMSVLIVGTFVHGGFSYQTLVETLNSGLGKWGVWVFGIGMFAAGFSSAITAPLASALTARSLFSGGHPEKWKINSFSFKAVWLFVLITGISLGAAGFKPVPAIILAQALNGLILPFISIFLVFVINNKQIMGAKNRNGWISNGLLMMVVWITLLLGIMNLMKALKQIFTGIVLSDTQTLWINLILSLFVWLMVLYKLFQTRKTDFSDSNEE
jgi:Mn2+/Fe2+ NRAMP family transporter